MNKKLLLSTTIAGTMLFVGMSNSFAVSNVRVNQSWVDSQVPSVAIELDKGETKLSEEALKEILNKKFYNGCVASITKSVNNNNVGTGSIINLTNGSSYTLVLLGDVDGDGSIGPSDATAILNHRAGNSEITSLAALKAADVANAAGVGASDAQRIMQYRADGALFSAPSAPTFVDFDRLPAQEALSMLTLSVNKIAGANETDPDLKKNLNQGVTGVSIKENTIELDLDLSVLEKCTHNREDAKWVKFALNTGIDNWKLENIDYEKGENGQPVIWVKGEEKEIKFTVSNADKSTEKLEITLNVIDSQMPLVSAASKGTVSENDDENMTFNMSQYTKYNGTAGTFKTEEDANTKFVTNTKYASNGQYAGLNSVTCSLNANLMNAYANTLDDTGKWYKVQFTTNLPATKLAAVDDTGREYFVEDGGAVEGKTNEYYTIVWLDANNATTNLVIKNKYASDDQVATAFEGNANAKNKRVISVALDLQSQVKLENVWLADSAISGEDVTYPNLNANEKNLAKYTPKSANGADKKYAVEYNAYSLTVRGALSDMKAFDLSTEIVDFKDLTWAKATRKWYPIIVSTGYDVSKLAVEGVQGWEPLSKHAAARHNTLDSLDTCINSDKDDIILWLDASQKETNVVFRTEADTIGGQKQEVLQFTVLFEDTTRPDVKSVSIADIGPNKKAVQSVEYKVNADSGNFDGTFNLSLKTYGLDQDGYTIELGEDIDGYPWDIDNGVALKIKTGVSREMLQWSPFESARWYPCSNYDVEGLADDEIIVWVDCDWFDSDGASTAPIKIRNIADQKTINWQNKGKGKQALQVKVTPVEIGALGDKNLTVVKNTVPSTTQNSVKELLNKEDPTAYDAYVKNMQAVDKVNDTLNDEDSIVIEAASNAMDEFIHNGVKGKWITVTLGLKDKKSVSLVDNENVDVKHTEYFSPDATATQTYTPVTLWVDVNKLPTGTFDVSFDYDDENATDYIVNLETTPDPFECVEKKEIIVCLANNSVVETLDKDDVKVPDENKVNTALPSGEQAGFKKNQACIQKVEVAKDGTTISIYADYTKMEAYNANGAGEMKYFAAVISLGNKCYADTSNVTKVELVKYNGEVLEAPLTLDLSAHTEWGTQNGDWIKWWAFNDSTEIANTTRTYTIRVTHNTESIEEITFTVNFVQTAVTTPAE